MGKIFVFPSAVAQYYAPSDLSGVHGMHRERIRSTESWSKGPERRDCVFVVHSDDLPGLRGMDIAQVKLLFKIEVPKQRGRHIRYYPCALVSWFSVIGDEPCPDTGMWRVEPDFDQKGDRSMSIVHLEAILRGAHLIGVANDEFLPHQLKHTDSLTSFRAFHVNRFIDYHAHEILS